jgi:hypothetical protein
MADRVNVAAQGPPVLLRPGTSSSSAGAGFFQVLGVSLFIGREFTTDGSGRGPVTILSAELWRSLFGADRSVVDVRSCCAARLRLLWG